MKEKTRLPKLPNRILVEIDKTEGGKYFVDLPELGVFTEADHKSEIIYQVNDLIYTFYEIPKKLQPKVHFYPPKALHEELMGMDKELARRCVFQHFIAKSNEVKHRQSSMV